MQVHGQHTVDTRRGEHIGHQLGRNRHARRARTAILTGIAEVGNGGGNATGGSTLERIHHDQQFHQVVIGRRAGGLQHEDIAATHVFLQLDTDFTIGKPTDVGTTEATLRRFAAIGSQF